MGDKIVRSLVTFLAVVFQILLMPLALVVFVLVSLFYTIVELAGFRKE